MYAFSIHSHRFAFGFPPQIKLLRPLFSVEVVDVAWGAAAAAADTTSAVTQSAVVSQRV